MTTKKSAPSIRRRPRIGFFGIVAVLAAALTACSTASQPSQSPTTSAPTTVESQVPAEHPEGIPALPEGWSEKDVSFDTELGTFHGTYTRPEASNIVPAALIIGGSGNVDRDGNQPPALANMNTLLTLSRWLADDGVATLRYDKLGSGDTGMGNTAEDTELTFTDYLTTNGQALSFLAGLERVDPEQVSVVGHSEGALFALMLAAGNHGTATQVPPVHAVAGLSPLSLPILDVVERQLTNSITQAEEAGQLTADQAQQYIDAGTAAITAVRAGEPIPADTPPDIAAAFPRDALTYLQTEDAVDPRDIAANLPRALPVLFSCSDADIQVTCNEVIQLATAANQTSSSVELIELEEVSHILKEDASRTTQHYNDDLPFSAELRQAIATWTKQ